MYANHFAVQTEQSDTELEPSPIATDWIVAGQPQAHSRQWNVSADGTLSTHVWSCTAGVFDWTFAADEVVTIVAGSVHVVGPDGTARTLQTGDSAFFHAGTQWRWTVDDYVRKHAVLSSPLPAPLVGLKVVLRRVKSLLGGRAGAASRSL